MKEIFADIVVVGGGSAGVAAACTAGRMGAKVILLEKTGMLGGQATLAQVGTVCGLYARGSFETTVIGSFGNEVRERLLKRNGNRRASTQNGLSYLPYSYRDFEAVCYDLVDLSPIELYLHSTVYGVTVQDQSILSVLALVGSTPTKIHANSFIEASGESLISKFAMGESIVDKEYQAPGYVCHLTNLELPKEITENDINLVLLKELSTLEDLRANAQEKTRFSVVPGSMGKNSLSLKFSYPFTRKNTFNEHTALEKFGRMAIYSVYQALKEKSGIFKNSELAMVAPQVGIRSGPRSSGRTILTVEDVRSAKKFDDGVANGVWPIEFWTSERKPQMEYFLEGDYYQIPSGCLQSKDYINLFLSGRGISADEKALSSARVIGTCLGTGAAAGYLASGLLAKENLTNTILKIRKLEML